MKAVSIIGGAQKKTYPTTGEVWTVNFRPPRRQRYTRCFQLHPVAGRNYAEDIWLEECDKPVYTLQKEKNKNSVVYPLKQAMSLGGPLCSSFDYMMALAILEGFKQIDLYGIALQIGSPRERLMEHVSLAYWIGYARARGIKVHIHGTGVLYFPYLYGYDYQKERTFGQRMSFWAALGMLNFKFDDGAAKTGPQGWKMKFDPAKVEIGI